MAVRAELAEQQRRALDRLTPLARELEMYLAGGTAIAFHLHHRVSRDLDLFSEKPTLDLEQVRSKIVLLPNVALVSITDATIRLILEGVPVDIVNYPYALLNQPEEGPGKFPVASLEDLVTMKLSAAARRGIRRDFWDLHEIFRRGALTLAQALASYVRRYGVKESDRYHVLRALTYFDDAEADPLLPAGMSPERWAETKAWFQAHVPEVLRGLVDLG